jgi:hypothetical protein
MNTDLCVFETYNFCIFKFQDYKDFDGQTGMQSNISSGLINDMNIIMNYI